LIAANLPEGLANPPMMTSTPISEGAAATTATVPAVSVVVPCYNGGRFLDDLMASLAHQTFRNFEIVIVDDGSTDELTLRKLAALEGQARVIHQKNRGLPAARNIGIREARADIVFPLDCDDTIEPTFLAETIPALAGASPDVAMIVTHIRYVGAETRVIPRYFNRFDLLFTNTSSNALVFRKEAWRAVGGYDETMRQGYEDWEFNLRLAEAGYHGIEVAKPLYNYRIANADSPSMLQGIQAKRMFAKLWRELRSRHPQSYRLFAMIRLWSQTRDGSGRYSLFKGMAGYLLALTLPDAAFNQLFLSLQRGRRRTGQQADPTKLASV
jgi:glycosyltransferase involved in cell wall biosynthesis